MPCSLVHRHSPRQPSSSSLALPSNPSPDTFQAVHRINLLGSFLVASRVASVLVKQYLSTLPPGSKAPKQAEEDQGVIVLTSSVSATEGQMGQVAYGSSKAAVEGLVLPMSRDLARYGASTFLFLVFLPSCVRLFSSESRAPPRRGMSAIRWRWRVAAAFGALAGNTDDLFLLQSLPLLPLRSLHPPSP